MVVYIPAGSDKVHPEDSQYHLYNKEVMGSKTGESARVKINCCK